MLYRPLISYFLEKFSEKLLTIQVYSGRMKIVKENQAAPAERSSVGQEARKDKSYDNP